MSRLFLPQSARLTSQPLTDKLFAEGHTAKSYPVLVRFLHLTDEAPGLQAVFTAPKRRFRRAVHRNRIKRQLRECFRLQVLPKHDTWQLPGCLLVAYIYVGPWPSDYAQLQKSMDKAMDRVKQQLSS